jgi:ATP-dependent DNA helicase RecG
MVRMSPNIIIPAIDTKEVKFVTIKNLIGTTESEILEWKSSFSQLNRIIETISAFSNTKGGTIIIGVDGTGKILGISIGKDTIEQLTNKIISNTEPKIYPDISIRKFEEKNLIVIRVDKYPYDIVLAFGRPYKRVGKSTIKMSKDEYERLILDKHKDKLYFDSQICKEATLGDIDKEKIKWFLRKAKVERSLDIDSSASSTEALKRLNLLIDNKPTNTAILMFGKNPQRFFIQSEVRCARFKGIEAVKPFIDMKVINGSIYEQIDQAEKFILFNIKKSAWIEAGKIERQEKWEYPPDAIREAIINAIAHRDYNSPANMHISIFDDRIEIWNPGKLPPPLTPKDLKEEHKSIPVNPSLANLLFLIKYIERWGTGTNDIIKWCREEDLPEPIFKEVTGGFAVVLRKFQIPENLESLELNERQKKAIEYLKIHKNITRKIYMEINNISPRQANKDLNDLFEKKLIRKQGRGRAISYVLK